MTTRRRLLAAAPALALPLIGGSAAGAKATTPVLASRPPMGWNSWNSFATTLTEEQALETARIMANKLLPHGYSVFTVDIQWYEPGATGYDYHDQAALVMDDHGRLLPAPNRFPSSVDGKGFKPLADQIHAMGLKFGVHLMRGIPRLAVERKLPVFGTNYTAADIADVNSTCAWNKDMYGVDMTKPGAQAYYNSVFARFAQWGVDFVKMDDMSRVYGEHYREIEAAHKAILTSKRPMVLSLSPGETDLKWAKHVQTYANMWRISDDFWDEWRLLKDQFKRLENWNPYRMPGHWPDADMLPLGVLALGNRKTKFTPDEQQTLMTLWSIARSPLIMGGDLRALDSETLALLTNDEVLAVNQTSSHNHPLAYKNDGDDFTLWAARSATPGRYYLALFNVEDTAKQRYALFHTLGLKGKWKVRDLWTHQDLGAFTDRFEVDLPPHGSGLYALSRA